jgi:RimJ/RimL family protein N-acetyltransferase
MSVSHPVLGPKLETPRLILRPPRPEDFDAFAAMMADEDTARFIGGVMPRAQAWRAWAAITGGWVLQGFGNFSVIEKESGAWIGRIGPWMPEGWPGTEVGWALARSAWGKGYATEAAIATIDWAFDTLGWCDVIHCIESVNAPSIAVATRLGSTLRRQKRLPPPHQHIVSDIYGQTRAVWRAGRASG